MKVQEEDTDRRAVAHLHIRGTAEALREYGEYIDEDDKAICCYVAVEDGDELEVKCKFWGTTMAIFRDVSVDGILRKSIKWSGKSFSKQSSKALDIDKFLFQTGDDIMDTGINITTAPDLISVEKHGIETIGTIELRLYALRTPGEGYISQTSPTYYSSSDTGEESIQKEAHFTRIPVQFVAKPKKDCETVDKASAVRFKRNMEKLRPGKEPWAIFRFHYRLLDSIEDHDMPQTWDPKNKRLETAHSLDLEPIESYSTDIAQAKHDDDDSTFTASPTYSTPTSPVTVQAPPDFPNPGRKQPTSSEYDEKTARPEATSSYILESSGRDVITTQENTDKDTLSLGEDHTMASVTSIDREGILPLTLGTMSVPSPGAIHAPKRPAPPTTSDSSNTKRQQYLSLTDTRRHLIEIKKQREKLAEERTKVKAQLKPYEAALAERQERLKKELEEQRRAMAEEEEELDKDRTLLAECEGLAN